MSTFDKTVAGAANGVIPFTGPTKRYVLSNVIDLTGGPIVQGDVYQSLAIPAGTLVESVHYKTLKAAVGTTLTEDVGDGGSAAGWIGSTDGKATAGVYDHSTVGTDARAVAANNGYFYASADSIDVTMTTATAITAGPKFAIFAVCVDLNE